MLGQEQKAAAFVLRSSDQWDYITHTAWMRYADPVIRPTLDVKLTTHGWQSARTARSDDRRNGQHLLNSELTFAVCCRPSVCRLSVTFVRRTQPVEIFGNVSMPFGTLAICWHAWKILRRSCQGNPSVGGVKRKRGNQIGLQRCWTYRRLYLGNGAR